MPIVTRHYPSSSIVCCQQLLAIIDNSFVEATSPFLTKLLRNPSLVPLGSGSGFLSVSEDGATV